jgi:tetratricopeptide (TPR) repeat protein
MQQWQTGDMINSIYKYMEHLELLDKESLYEIRSLLIRYPYFQTLRLLYLNNLYILGDKDFDEELHKSAIYLNERKVLFSIIEGNKYYDDSVKGIKHKDENISQDRTESLIDAFLSTNEEDVEKIRLSIEATTNYTSLLLKDSDIEQLEMRGQKLIDDFVRKDNKIESESVIVEEDKAHEIVSEVDSDNDLDNNLDSAQSEYDDDEESYFTETLAKIYVKQGKYSKAIEIIKKLNLKYPKKNVYFVDQIRFLEKLIINTKSK